MYAKNLDNSEDNKESENEEEIINNEEENKNINENQESEEEDKIYFEPQYKKSFPNKIKNKKTKKRIYIEAMGEENDLKKFLEQIKL